MDWEKDVDKRVSDRKSLKTKIEFYFDSDIVEATSVNVSETGFRFDTEEPVQIFFRMGFKGVFKEGLAKFVWAKKKRDDGMAYGLEFVSKSEESLLPNSEKI